MLRDYLALRRFVGYLAIGLPVVLPLGNWLFFGGDLENSISEYYGTKMGDVFVATLGAIAVFLFFYRGYDEVDNWAGNLAGIFALGVALCPESGDWSGVHFGSAGLLFVTLAFFSLFLFTRGEGVPTPRKILRNWVYRVTGYLIVLCVVALGVYFLVRVEVRYFVFVLEAVALWSFGLSWLVKGEAMLADQSE